MPGEPESLLRRVRVSRRISQRELAEATGLSLRTIQRLEAVGHSDNPPLRYLVNCAMALDVPLEDILESEWLSWRVFDVRAGTPPEPGWWDQGPKRSWGHSRFAQERRDDASEP